MKRWEEQRRLKAHKKKLRGIKSTIQNVQGKNRKQGSIKKTKIKSYGGREYETSEVLSTTSIDNSFAMNKSQITDYYDFEKADMQSIPLFRLLKLYNLQ